MNVKALKFTKNHKFHRFHGNGRFSRKKANFTENDTAVKSWIRLVLNYVLNLSVRSSIRQFIRLLPDVWTRYKPISMQCKLAQVVHGARAWNAKLWGFKVKGQGHKANDRLGGMAETAFSAHVVE